MMAGGMLITASRHVGRPQRPRHKASPRAVREKDRVGESSPEVETRRISECGRQRYRVPDRSRLNQSICSMGVGFAPERYTLADKCPGSDLGGDEALPGEALVGDGH